MEPIFENKAKIYREKYNDFVVLIKERLTEKRFFHSLAVAKEAVRLAEKYGADTEKAFLAGLLHDICKNDTPNQQLKLFKEFGIILDAVEKNSFKLWHAISGAVYAEKILNLKDLEIISAIRYHTTAKAGMTLLEKILYLADFTSEDRDYPGVFEMREAVDKSLSEALNEALDFTIKDLKEKNCAIHKDTIKAYEELKRS